MQDVRIPPPDGYTVLVGEDLLHPTKILHGTELRFLSSSAERWRSAGDSHDHHIYDISRYGGTATLAIPTGAYERLFPKEKPKAVNTKTITKMLSTDSDFSIR